MKVKIEVKSWNNYPPPPRTHLRRERGLFDLPCAQGQLFKDAKLFNGTTKYQTFILSPKINLFGLHKKLHGVHGNPSGTVAGSFASRPKIDTCVLHILS